MVKKRRLFMETTNINPERTVSQIQKVLSGHDASAILTEYKEQQIESVSFKLVIQKHHIPFRLPCRWRAVLSLLSEKHRPSPLLEDKARRVAWRQILRWVEAQCALVQTGMVKIEEVFLPYIQAKNGLTFFETMEKGQSLLTWEDKK